METRLTREQFATALATARKPEHGSLHPFSLAWARGELSRLRRLLQRRAVLGEPRRRAHRGRAGRGGIPARRGAAREIELGKINGLGCCFAAIAEKPPAG